MENEDNKKPTLNKVKEESEKIINSILDEGIKQENIEFLYKIIDIHKDIANEEYWQVKKEDIDMRYRGYSEGYGEYNEGGNYGRRGVPGTGRGRYRDGGYSDGGYSEGGSYGRRGVPGTGRGRYRGEEMMDEMMYHYGNYNEGREQYGADEETMKSFKYMLKSFKDYYKHLKQEASSQQEVKMLEDVAREISEM